MGHTHTADRNAYYLDQLCSIGACGAMGVISILMYSQDRLKGVLRESFFLPVLLGGIALVALTIVRGVTLWREAGRAAAHNHEYHHDHDGPCDHGDDDACAEHEHAEGWTPAKYAVLLLPVVLYMLGLPNSGFSEEGIRRMLGDAALEGGGRPVTAKAGVVLGFHELGKAASNEAARKNLEGQTGKLKGMYMRITDKEFTLYRIKMRCCAADVVPVQVRIFSPTNVTRFENKGWVEVEGRIQFLKVPGMDKYMPVLTLESADAVQKTEPDSSEFDVS